VPFEWKLDPCIHDYLDRGTLEIIDEGAHRESLFWITLFFAISTLAIQQDGLPEEKEHYAVQMAGFMHALGIGSAAAIKQRTALCKEVHDKSVAYINDFVATSPLLKD
jgi:hypothetical protein